MCVCGVWIAVVRDHRRRVHGAGVYGGLVLHAVQQRDLRRRDGAQHGGTARPGVPRQEQLRRMRQEGQYLTNSLSLSLLFSPSLSLFSLSPIYLPLPPSTFLFLYIFHISLYLNVHFIAGTQGDNFKGW